MALQKTIKDESIYIANEEHYEQVIERIKTVKKTLWIGTADIKDLYVKDGRGSKPLLEVLSNLAKRGVEIRLIHAKEPENTRNFEAGVLSGNREFVKNAAKQFDSVWMGAFCKECRRKKFCGDPIQ